MYTILLSKQVQKQLTKLNKDFLLVFKEKMAILSKNPFSHNLDIKRIKWDINKYRLRIWKYRIIYKIDKSKLVILVLKLNSRWDIYKQ